MALVRWEPFREFERQPMREFGSLQREMNRLFDSLVRTGDGELANGPAFMPAA